MWTPVKYIHEKNVLDNYKLYRICDTIAPAIKKIKVSKLGSINNPRVIRRTCVASDGMLERFVAASKTKHIQDIWDAFRRIVEMDDLTL